MENQTDNLNRSGIVDEEYQTTFEQLLPFIIILIVYMFLGVLENSTVLYIYLRKLKSYNNGRFFIPVLAVADMLACVVNCSLHFIYLDVTTARLPNRRFGLQDRMVLECSHNCCFDIYRTVN